MVPAQHPATSSTSRTSCAACPSLEAADAELLLEAKQTASPTGSWRTSGTRSETEVRRVRKALRHRGRVQVVDTCAAEFEAYTPYYYSTYETPVASQSRTASRDDVRCDRGRDPPADRQGPHHDPRRRAEPHRPGHRVRLLLLPGRVRPARRRATRPSWSTRTRRPSRPTTTRSDHLFFEPLTVEDVLNICDRDEAEGADRAVRRADAAEPGQAPWRRPACRSSAPASIASTSPRTASGSRSWSTSSACKQPANGTALDVQQALHVGPADRLSRCWCGRASSSAAGPWRSSTTRTRMSRYIDQAMEVSPGKPVLIDKFLEVGHRGRRRLPVATARARSSAA